LRQKCKVSLERWLQSHTACRAFRDPTLERKETFAIDITLVIKSSSGRGEAWKRWSFQLQKGILLLLVQNLKGKGEFEREWGEYLTRSGEMF